MPEMDARDEVDSPLTVNATSPPKPMGEMASASAVSDPPTPAVVLKWIAAAKGEPWFASRHAAETGIDRDCLDEPMNVLRLAGLIRIDTWVRGVGQGYVLTPEGRDAARTGLGLPSTPGALPQIPTNDTPAAPGPTLPSPPTAEEQLAVRVGIDPRPPLMVPLFIVVNVLCFLVGLAGAVRGGYPLGPYLSNGHAYILHRLGAVTGDDLLQGQWWRLFTCCFVHIGIVHLLVNLFTLGMLGLLAESLWGRWRLAAIYFISGLAGSCMAMAIEPGGMLAGASGALWGLLMSLVAWLAAYRRELPPDIATDWVRKLWIVFILNVGISFLPGISWQAHLGGGIAGLLAA
ncbi:MAG TPA: rhomboid family intramembrane serine protease, partial [Gemmata sp.]|nr:rhomboid family intramembrane serine protease [Gemmata sp.]